MGHAGSIRFMHGAVMRENLVIIEATSQEKISEEAIREELLRIVESPRGREAGLLLRNYVETVLEYLKRSESDSGVQRTFRRDLEAAKEVQQAFFPEQTMSIPCVSRETFYQPARGIGGDYYDLLAVQRGRW